ncbi:hypothetical protein B0F90DRAFT_1928003 [Multifurca ochricompacta]|uniref:Uncharacterized protein n=1 Tax=Multifurca ochricompacta TaxID=376703 RepID=A0AAD4LY13_9AGAM|nr:hypothetical protein B0F90DRAFT_1928003 [Multifurca ochricompacta]
MANLLDVFSLLFTTAFIVGSVLGISLVVRKCHSAIEATKASLEERGWKVSSHGITIKSTLTSTSSSNHHNHRQQQQQQQQQQQHEEHSRPIAVVAMNRELYLDVTQRGFIKAFQASTFGHPSSSSFSASRAGTSAGASAGMTTITKDDNSEHKHRKHFLRWLKG